jgi:hypothetical protein
MRTLFTAGLLLLTLVLAHAPSARATPQTTKAPPKKQVTKPSADPLAKAILGTWVATVPNQSGAAPGRVSITFKADGTQNQVVEGNGRKANLLATYHVANGWLTQTLVRAEEGGKPITLPNAGTKKLKVRLEGDTLYISTGAPGDTGMPLKRVKK